MVNPMMIGDGNQRTLLREMIQKLKQGHWQFDGLNPQADFRIWVII